MRKFVLSILYLLLIVSLGHPAQAVWEKEKLQKAPDFPWGGTWFNTRSLSRKTFRDKVTLVYFWDFSAINVIRELSILKRWEAAYRLYGFQMIWIHAPVYPFSKEKNSVEQALERFGISSPVYLDNEFKLWEAYKVRLWPTKILVNGEGKVFYTQPGESGYVDTENKIREGLSGLESSVLLPKPVFEEEPLLFSLEKCGIMMTEMPLGYKRFSWWGGEIANKRWIDPDGTLLFKDRGNRVERGFAVEGLWTNGEEAFIHARRTEHLTDFLGILYQAAEVYVIISTPEKKGPSIIHVTRNDEPVPPPQRGSDLLEDERGSTYFVVEEPGLYYLIADEDDTRGFELKLWTQEEGVAIHAFAYSNRCSSDFEHL